MAGKEHLKQFDDDDMHTNSIILALPQSFAKVETEIEREPSIKSVVYNHLDDMADQLNKIAISASILWVWPNRMPRSDQMRRCMQAIERHLQCGGTLDCFPAPFEKCSKDEWNDLRRACIEAVRMLTGPARGFDARVVDHYGPLVDSGWQALVFLEQLREAASSTLRLPKFKLKPRKKPENFASSQGPTTSQDKNERNDDETEKKKRKIPKRPELMYLWDPMQKEEQAPNVKQRGRGP
ncbi:hypothetical protein Aduo_012464 [Ancylostoma duodenale]